VNIDDGAPKEPDKVQAQLQALKGTATGGTREDSGIEGYGYTVAERLRVGQQIQMGGEWSVIRDVFVDLSKTVRVTAGCWQMAFDVQQYVRVIDTHSYYVGDYELIYVTAVWNAGVRG
jgi:hypothetical protein